MTPNTAIGTKNATHSKRVAVAKGGNHRLFSGARPPSSSKAMEKARAAPGKPSGTQTVRQLIGQNQGVSNIEITNSNIKGFERIARKYGVDFAVKKDRSVSPPKYFVFFKARDADALTAAFKEYTAYELKRAAKAQNRPSVLAHLQALKAKVQAITPGKSRNQNRGITI